MATPTIVLFDIDGTLLRARGAGKRALERAFGQHFGVAEAFAAVEFAGCTDPAILRAALEGLGQAAEASLIQTLLDSYLRLLADELRRTVPEVLPGVPELLAALQGQGELAVGLGTGNVEAGARLKLGAVGLSEHFDFGGFGCDAEERAALLEAGVRRGAARLGRRREECTVWVVGDTPRDIAAARAIGARVVAVATGPFQRAELAGADRTTESLADHGVREALVGAGAP